MNVKSCFEGIAKRDIFSTPISGLTDQKIEWLKNFIGWLQDWWSNPDCIGLMKDTYEAILHTSRSMVTFTKYVFSQFPIKYLLLGKIQTDPLEQRFGWYRNLSGCNYHISVSQLIESEKKIRLQHLLKNNSLRELIASTKEENSDTGVEEFMPILERE